MFFSALIIIYAAEKVNHFFRCERFFHGVYTISDFLPSVNGQLTQKNRGGFYTVPAVFGTAGTSAKVTRISVPFPS